MTSDDKRIIFRINSTSKATFRRIKHSYSIFHHICHEIYQVLIITVMHEFFALNVLHHNQLVFILGRIHGHVNHLVLGLSLATTSLAALGAASIFHRLIAIILEFNLAISLTRCRGETLRVGLKSGLYHSQRVFRLDKSAELLITTCPNGFWFLDSGAKNEVEEGWPLRLVVGYITVNRYSAWTRGVGSLITI